MIDTNSDTPRMQSLGKTDAVSGNVQWSAKKSIWYLGHLSVALIGGVLYFSWSGVLVFLITTAVTLCLGHSLGMHRRLIHNSYECPQWLEYFFVHLGVLVGMAGPFGMIHQHDLRDWAQRRKKCHNYLKHAESFLKDGWWQLNCDLVLDHPPIFEPEERIRDDKVYWFMEKTWMMQQLPWALILFYVGGISWVVWGICTRVAVSVTGHWLVGHFAHDDQHGDWVVEGAAVQGQNVKFAALITMGESWHNNHHAFPGSAKLGIAEGQLDPGWWVLRVMSFFGLAWNIRLPKDLATRPELVRSNIRYIKENVV